MSNVNDLLVSVEEKNKIKNNSPETLPLNPTAQGYSGQEVRRKLYASIVGEKGSVLSLLSYKMIILKSLLEGMNSHIDDEIDILLNMIVQLSSEVVKEIKKEDTSTINTTLERIENEILIKNYLKVSPLNELIEIDDFGIKVSTEKLDLETTKILVDELSSLRKEIIELIHEKAVDVALPLDGSKPMEANLNIGNHNIENVYLTKTRYLQVQELDTIDGLSLIYIKKDIYLSYKRIYNMMKGIGLTDGATLENIKDHDEDENSHIYLRTLIENLEKQIDRIEGRGRSYGEIGYKNSELVAMTENARNTTIYIDVKGRYPDYVQESGNLVYTKNEDVENSHEWEFNGTTWVDNGQWTVDKASNTEFGIVKGGNDYVSIISGLIQVLKSDYATRLGTQANAYTYESLSSIVQGINTALDNLYTKSETYNRNEIDAMEDELLLLIETLKAVYGWQESNIAQLNNADNTISKSTIDEYDFIILNYRDDSEDRVYTQIIKPSVLLSGDIVQLGTVTFGHDDTTYIATNLDLNDELSIVGLRMDGSLHNEVREVGETFIFRNSNNEVFQIKSDNIEEKIKRDFLGNVIEIETKYLLDNQTYKETFVRNHNGDIIKIKKERVL